MKRSLKTSHVLCFDVVRTTLTLDDDVAARLTQLRDERRVPFRSLVNDALRRGLEALDAPPPQRATPPTSAVSLGGALVPDVDDLSALLAAVEGDARR